jgi:hypothetical protein
MPLTHRLDDIDGPYLNTKEWKNSGARTSTGGGGKKPPKKPPTKTGGIPEEPKKPNIPYEREDRNERYKNGWYN